MNFPIDDGRTVILICVIVGIPIGLGLGFYLLTRHVNRQFDRRPEVEQPELDNEEVE